MALETFAERFHLHPDSSVRDAAGRLLLSAGLMSSDRSGSDLHGQSPSGSTCQSDLCFIADGRPLDTLRNVIIASNHAMAFCIVPGKVNDRPDRSMGHSGLLSDDSGLPQFQCLSSGTTGEARRIQRSHASWIRTFELNAFRMGIGIDDGYAILGRMTHSLPLYATLEACHLGADVHLLCDLHPARQLLAMSRRGSSVLYLTPTQARLLCRAQPDQANDLSCVRWVLCGGGKLEEKTRLALTDLFEKADIVEFYGASETSFISMSSADSPAASVGGAYPGVSIKVLDEHHKPADGVGEIWVKSEYLFTGYVQDDWRDTRRRDGYLSIGEMGRLDETGHLYLSGRKSRQANIADNTVFLQEIEAALLQHVGVNHCVVLTQQDPLRGETVIAVVEGNHDESLQSELLKYARRTLGAVLAPRNILFFPSLPVLHSGKPDLRLIQSMVDGR